MIALMIGGSQDGIVIETGNVPHIEGREPPRGRLSERLEEASQDYLPTRVHYDLTTVEILSLQIPVYIQRGWPQERVEATLAANLLSDLARRLAEQ